MTVNGEPVVRELDTRTSLLDLLRETRQEGSGMELPVQTSRVDDA